MRFVVCGLWFVVCGLGFLYRINVNYDTDRQK